MMQIIRLINRMKSVLEQLNRFFAFQGTQNLIFYNFAYQFCKTQLLSFFKYFKSLNRA